nr:MAG TPA: hypothetical protein [Caudoviricetes sp.]DAM85956.1 MAG TPA: hypothetical protein [Caudoviricetes sp.]
MRLQQSFFRQQKSFSKIKPVFHGFSKMKIYFHGNSQK